MIKQVNRTIDELKTVQPGTLERNPPFSNTLTVVVEGKPVAYLGPAEARVIVAWAKSMGIL